MSEIDNDHAPIDPRACDYCDERKATKLLAVSLLSHEKDFEWSGPDEYDMATSCDQDLELAKERLVGQSGMAEVLWVADLKYYEVHFPKVIGSFLEEEDPDADKRARPTPTHAPVNVKVVKRENADSKKLPYDLRTKEGKAWLETDEGQAEIQRRIDHGELHLKKYLKKS